MDNFHYFVTFVDQAVNQSIKKIICRLIHNESLVAALDGCTDEETDKNRYKTSQTNI